MKKTWIMILVVALVALIAIFAYNPDNSNVDQTGQSPDSNSESGQSIGNEVQPNFDDEDDDNKDDEDDDNQNALDTSNTSGSTTISTTNTVTLAELSTHDSKNDCWISYKSKVYDITDYLPVHPGSSAAISPYCGTSDEFEKAFTGQHGTSKVSTLEKRGVFKGNLM